VSACPVITQEILKENSCRGRVSRVQPRSLFYTRGLFLLVNWRIGGALFVNGKYLQVVTSSGKIKAGPRKISRTPS